jgi:hypothetical protein
MILDSEAAQVQGLGDALVRLQMNNPAISKISETNPEVLVQFLIKLCTIHWDRCVNSIMRFVSIHLTDLGILQEHRQAGSSSWGSYR